MKAWIDGLRERLTRQRPARDLLILVAVAGPSFFLNLGGNEASHIKEARVLETSREMLSRGDLWVPYFDGAPRFEKPPLAYWLCILGFKAVGEPTEAGGRIYSAAAGLLTVLILYAFGRSLGRPRVGLWAGLLLSTCILFFRGARHAELDVLLTLGVTAAVYAFWRALELPAERRGARIGWIVLGGSTAGFAFLAKQSGPAFIVCVLGAHLLLVRRWSGFRLLFHPLGIAAFLAVAAPWYVGIALGEDLAFEKFVSEARTAMEGRGHGPSGVFVAVFYHFLHVWPMFLPWSLALPFAVPAACRAERRTGPERIFLAWASAILGALLFVLQKQEHYLMPVMPALAWLSAAWLVETAPRTRVLNGRRAAVLRSSVLAAACVVALVVIFVPDFAGRRSRSCRAFAGAASKLVGDRPLFTTGLRNETRTLLQFHMGRLIAPLDDAALDSSLQGGGPPFLIVPARGPDGGANRRSSSRCGSVLHESRELRLVGRSTRDGKEAAAP